MLSKYPTMLMRIGASVGEGMQVYALKEVSWHWFFYVGFLLAITLLLYLPTPSTMVKRFLAVSVILASALGVTMLISTEYGQKLPLMNTFVQSNIVEPNSRAGLEVYIKYGCPNCHLLNGWGPAKAIGPDLAEALAKHEPAWLSHYLRDPAFRANSKNSVMPHYTFLKESEINKLTIFLESAVHSNRVSVLE